MNIIGIYPVSSQPPHLGHYRAYEYLKKITGNNTFVATTNLVEPPMAPLNFQEKQQIWTRHGIPIDKVVEVKNPTKAVEITKKFGPDRTSIIFAMSVGSAEKILQSNQSYFLKYTSVNAVTESMNKHAYILTIPTEVISINPSINADNIRNVISSKTISIEKKKSFFKQVFGWYDISLFELISKKFSEASVVKERFDESSIGLIKRFLKPYIKEILGELTEPSGINPTVDPTLSVTPVSQADAQKAVRDKKTTDDKTLKDKEKELDLTKKSNDATTKINKQKITNVQAQITAMKSSQL